jgi:hypothetical protein
LACVAKGGVFRPLVFPAFSSKFLLVPWSLKRFQRSRQLHYITFSCYRRQPRLNTTKACRLFLRQLEIARRSERKRIEKLRYIQHNPVKRGLVEKPEDWALEQFAPLLVWRGRDCRDRIGVDGQKT